MRGLLKRTLALAATLGFFALPVTALAAKLQIAPVLIDVAAPAAATSVSVTNAGQDSVSLQARLFRWGQKEGRDAFFRTKAVVVSPPILKLDPGKSGTIRIVRLDKSTVRGEEAYRLLIDELPKPATANRTTVKMVVRHSIPVFFSAANATPAPTQWSVSQSGGTVTVRASNPGQKRLKVSKLKLRGTGGGNADFGDGLAGYVLGNSSRAFTAPVTGRLQGDVQITATTNRGPLNQKVPLTR